MNIRGPFGESSPGIFSMTAQGLLKTHDRPKVTHRGVHVLREVNTSLGPLDKEDKYPDATGWEVDGDGQLDIWCADTEMSVVATYPSGVYKRVWFPGAEVHVMPMKLPEDIDVPANEDENGEREDVEPNEG